MTQIFQAYLTIEDLCAHACLIASAVSGSLRPVDCILPGSSLCIGDAHLMLKVCTGLAMIQGGKKRKRGLHKGWRPMVWIRSIFSVFYFEDSY